LLREYLVGTDLEPATATVELVVSELVTNAIVHTGGEIEVAAAMSRSGLRVEVADSGAHLPMVASYDAMASTGRGLHLVTELTDRWGVDPSPDGKVIWFQVGSEDGDVAEPDGDAATSHAEPRPRAEAADAVEVVLLDVPALVHGAWQQHAKAILREFLLMRLDTDAHAIDIHAATMDALAILEEQVGTPEAPEDPSELLVAAVEPNATWTERRLVVPAASVPHFDILDRQLDVAMEQARDGHLLTPPTQPEFRAFRRWLCEQVRVQAEGAPPRPWQTPVRPPVVPAARRTTWDGTAVSEADGAAIAADDTGRIIAASRAAAALLAYDSTDDLVGRRLVEIIPERYHQAHLAGFTLHHITGRGPLLGRTIVVPAQRHDGAEVEVAMCITASRAPDGGSVFVAALEEATRGPARRAEDASASG
jgi:PAS domain S-box-containing protein